MDFIRILEVKLRFLRSKQEVGPCNVAARIKQGPGGNQNSPSWISSGSWKLTAVFKGRSKVQGPVMLQPESKMAWWEPKSTLLDFIRILEIKLRFLKVEARRRRSKK